MAVSHTVHRQIAIECCRRTAAASSADGRRCEPCVRSDRRIDQAPPLSKEAGDFEQGVDHSNGSHRASRLAALSALAHLSQHLPCPRRRRYRTIGVCESRVSRTHLPPRVRSGWAEAWSVRAMWLVQGRTDHLPATFVGGLACEAGRRSTHATSVKDLGLGA